LYVGARQVADWYKEVRLIRHGKPVTAAVDSVNGKSAKGNSQPGDSPVILRFNWQGQPQAAAGHLAGRPAAQFIIVGEKVDIRVDPNDPALWTSRQQPAPLSGELGVPLAVVAAAGIVGAASWMLRRRALRSYQFGARAAARVISRFRSALAPRLWMARCVLIDSDDKQIYVVYIPSRFPSEPGRTVEVILPPRSGGLSRPLAAAWFE
jgi:hypothetical protein